MNYCAVSPPCNLRLFLFCAPFHMGGRDGRPGLWSLQCLSVPTRLCLISGEHTKGAMGCLRVSVWFLVSFVSTCIFWNVHPHPNPCTLICAFSSKLYLICTSFFQSIFQLHPCFSRHESFLEVLWGTGCHSLLESFELPSLGCTLESKTGLLCSLVL